MKRLVCLTLIFMAGCFQKPAQQNATQTETEEKGCPLPEGKYPIQESVFNKTKKTYEVMLLGAPACVEQPVVLSNVELGRSEKDASEKAIVIVTPAAPTKILVAEDYQMKMVETTVKNGVETTSEPSLWSPFLSGAAGAVVGGVVGGAIANKLMNRGTDNAAPTNTNNPTNTQTPNSNYNQTKDTTTYQKATSSSRSGGFFKKKRR